MEMQFSSVEEIKCDGKRQILKKANIEEREVTVEQIRYLCSLPNSIKHLFPSVIDYAILENEVWYTMPFYDMKTLDVALRDIDFPIEKLKKVLKNLIETIFRVIYIRDRKKAPENYTRDIHINRVYKRMNYLCKVRPDLVPLVRANLIKINDKNYRNPLLLLEELLVSSEFNKLNPDNIGFIHGDLEVNHVMFDVVEEKIELCLLDPRMPLYGGDYTYDLGKLWQAICGYSHELIAGNFNMSWSLEEGVPNVKFKINTSRPLNELRDLESFIETITSKEALLFKDNNWYFRCHFAQAIHFLSAPPFFNGEIYPEGLVEALYIRGVLLLNEFLERVQYDK